MKILTYNKINNKFNFKMNLIFNWKMYYSKLRKLDKKIRNHLFCLKLMIIKIKIKEFKLKKITA
jgi:hypothetical protein